MAFADELDDVAGCIEQFARMKLREHFPYMKTPTLDKVLHDTTRDLKSRFQAQEHVMRAAQSRTTFMSLPIELRNIIYEMVLVVDGGVWVPLSTVNRRCTALLQVNRQVCKETRPIWYSMNTFRFSMFEEWWRVSYPYSRIIPTPTDFIQGLRYLGPTASLIKSIVLDMHTCGAPKAGLRKVLKTLHRTPVVADLTVHQIVLKVFGILEVAAALEDFSVIKFRYHPHSSSFERPPATDFYEATGVDGGELLTEELLDRLR